MNRNEDLSVGSATSFFIWRAPRRAWYISISIARRRNEPIWDEGVSARAPPMGEEAAVAIRKAANMDGDGC